MDRQALALSLCSSLNLLSDSGIKAGEGLKIKCHLVVL